MKQYYLLLLFFSLIITQVHAGVLKGFVTDAKTGEPAIGAIVIIENTTLGNAVGLDGSYIIKDIPAGNYKVKITLLSYDIVERDVIVSDGKTEAIFNCTLAPETAKNLKEVSVVAHASGTNDAGARQLEKNADNILNILSGRTLQLMPDVTVANVLRRVSGVTVDRGEDGEGRYPVIRGMDKRYNYTLINGIKIPSPDDKNRYVPMDMFPSDMLQRLEVIKALTPDMEGDAIGGVMNLVMKDAPDHLLLQAQGALGYSQLLSSQPFTTYSHSDIQAQSPAEVHGNTYVATFNDFSKGIVTYKQSSPLPDGQLGLTLGNRFFNRKLGVIISGSMHSTDRNSHEIFFDPSPQPTPILNGSHPEITDMETRYYSTHEDRLGLHAKLDYDIDEHNKISFYALLMKLNTYQYRYIIDSTSIGRTAAGTGVVDQDYRSKTTLQSIYNATLQGQHNIKDHFYIDWSAVYSLATQKTPDWAELGLEHELLPDSSGHNTPPLLQNSLSYIWQHNSDQDLAGYLNLHYKFKAGAHKFDIGVGAMYRHKDRDNYFNQYSLVPPANSPFTNIYNSGFAFSPASSGVGTPQNGNIYTATENISAAYAEVRWNPSDCWNIIGGVRWENTYQSYDQTAEDSSVYGKYGTVTYLDVLPSLNIKYKLTDKAALHFSYFKSITRPGFFEIVPYVFPGEYFTETGNDSLKHTQADNFDVRYELFPGSADQLLIGAFYKRIQNPIEYTYARPAVAESVIMPTNVGTATNFGGEIVYTKYFKHFGFSLNYTYTHSDIPTTKKYYYNSDSANGLVKYVTINRPLQGQAAHVGNLSLLYKDPKSGIELQIAVVYTGRHIVYLSAYNGTSADIDDMDYWQRGNIILDFSGEKTLGKHFAVFAKANNLLNTPDIVEMMYSSSYLNGLWPDQNRSDRILVEKKYFGQTYLVGIRYHL